MVQVACSGFTRACSLKTVSLVSDKTLIRVIELIVLAFIKIKSVDLSISLRCINSTFLHFLSNILLIGLVF